MSAAGSGGRARTRNAAAASKPGPIFVLDDHIYYLFTQIVGRRNRHIAEKLKPFGVTVPKWRVLATLYARPAVTMNQLAEHTTIDRTTLTRTLDRMVRDKLVVRRTDPSDRRSVRLELTANGEQVFGRVLPLVMEDNARSFADMRPAELAQFRNILVRIVGNLDRNYHAAKQED